jgi:hypothetical protein
VQGAVGGDVVGIEADDPVMGIERVATEPIEDTGCDPLAASGPEGRVGDLVAEDRLDTDPGASRDQPDEDPPGAQPVRDPRSVAAQWVRLGSRRDQSFDGRPESIYNFGLERAHDEDSSTVSSLLGSHSGSSPSQPDDRWMVISSAHYQRGP